MGNDVKEDFLDISENNYWGKVQQVWLHINGKFKYLLLFKIVGKQTNRPLKDKQQSEKTTNTENKRIKYVYLYAFNTQLIIIMRKTEFNRQTAKKYKQMIHMCKVQLLNLQENVQL